MTSSRSKWLATVLAVPCLGVGFAYGFAAHRQQFFPYRQLAALYARVRPEPQARIWWPLRRAGASARPPAPRDLALPYLAGYEPASAERGVLRHERAAVQPGLNFYNSGHEPRALLVDLSGKPRHEWTARFAQVWPGREVPRGQQAASESWSFARLLADGGVLGVFGGLGLVRLDRDSKVVWARPEGFHHEVAVAEDGTFYAILRRLRSIPALNPRVPVYEDFIVTLDAAGRTQREVSLVECFEHSRYASLLGFVDHLTDDPFHTNAVRLLDGSWAGRGRAFRRGNVLVSLPRLDTVAVVDLEARRVEWALTGLFVRQHDPTPLPNGRLLVFDNWGRGGRSRVVELDPATQDVAWEFPKDDSSDFYSQCCGAAQRLANGDTLVTESTNGRVLEVTPDGRVVWEFVNPARAGADQELVATIFRMERVDEAFVRPWLEPGP